MVGVRLGVDELGDERHARFIGPRRAGDRLLAVHAAALGQAVPAVRVDDAVLRQVPQPQVERHVRLLQVLGEPLIGLDQHVLHDVGGIDAAGDGRVEPQVDDAAERLAELAEQLVDGTGFALAGVVEQPVGLARGWATWDIRICQGEMVARSRNGRMGSVVLAASPRSPPRPGP